MRFILTIATLTLFGLDSQGSGGADTIPTIYFQVTDAGSGRPIQMAHVYNFQQQTGVISDMMGFFHLPVAKGDTLKISAIGYYNMLVPSFGQFTPDSALYPIRMTSRIYEIREVIVTRFGSYQRFLRGVAALNLPKSEQELTLERVEAYFDRTITGMDLKNLPSSSSGFFFGRDWYAIQMAKLEARRREEVRWEIMLRKFSAPVVMELTGMSESEVIGFMEFCGFTEAFLLTASEYEVRLRILEKHREYSKKLERGSS